LHGLKSLGITSAIENRKDAINIISALVRFMGLENLQRKYWMIDEFQRIDDCKENVRKDIYGCLASVFNKCPHHLAIILSASTDLT